MANVKVYHWNEDEQGYLEVAEFTHQAMKLSTIMAAAWRYTNSLHGPWWRQGRRGEGGSRVLPKRGALTSQRGTTVGDLVEVDGIRYKLQPVGFTPLVKG